MAAPAIAAAAAPAVSPWIAAGGAMAGGLATSAFNLFTGEQSRDYNRDMAGSAHQREVKDLRAAGLNPVLSAGGHGASVAPSPTPQSQDFMGTSKAIEAMHLRNQSRLVDAQVRDINSAAALKEIEGRIKLRTEPESVDHIRETLYQLRNLTGLTDLQKREIEEKIKILGIEQGIKQNEKTHSALGLSHARSESEFYSGPGGDIEHWARMLGIQIPGIGALRLLKGQGRGGKKVIQREQRESNKHYERFKDERKAGEPLKLKPEYDKLRKGGM